MKTGKFRSAVWADRLVAWKREWPVAAEFPLAREGQFSVSFRPSTDWMWPAYIMAGNLLYSEFSALHANFIHDRPPACHTQQVNPQAEQMISGVHTTMVCAAVLPSCCTSHTDPCPFKTGNGGIEKPK